MLKSILYGLRGVMSLLFYTLNTIACCIPIFIIALIKAMMPIKPIQNGCRRIITAIATCWIAVNNLNQRLFNGIRWDVQGLENLNPKGWYMVVANHQSWVDILVLQNVFHRKIPFLKFFLKKELFWFPVLGQAWWALDFPFMKRYSRQFLKKHPHLIGKDLEITKRACEKFRNIPVSVMNFVEGTRFTPEKHARQRSPYSHLLRTKAGGLAYVLSVMGDKLHHIVDVTIAYPQGVGTFWDFVCGRVKEVKVRVKTLPINNELMGDYHSREKYEKYFTQIMSRLVELQGSDGYWRSSLLDPESFPSPEASATGFYTYGLWWGINNGLLDKESYLEPATRAWEAMVKAVQPSGKLGYVQAIGDTPKNVSARSYETYGTAAFMLAGLEVSKYITKSAVTIPQR